MIKNDKTNIDEKYKRFEKIHDKIKFKAFGKVTIRQRRIPKDKLEVVGKDTATEQRTSKKSQYSCPKNMTGSFQNGRTSSKMWGPSFNIVSLPKIACKIVRPFKPDFRERWQVSEFSVSSRKTRSDQGNSRSRLEV